MVAAAAPAQTGPLTLKKVKGAAGSIWPRRSRAPKPSPNGKSIGGTERKPSSQRIRRPTFTPSGYRSYTVSVVADTAEGQFPCPDSGRCWRSAEHPVGTFGIGRQRLGHREIRLSWSDGSRFATEDYRIEQSTDGSRLHPRSTQLAAEGAVPCGGPHGGHNVLLPRLHDRRRGAVGLRDGLRDDHDIPSGDLPENDDSSTGQLDIGIDLNFYGTEFSQVYLNNNGNITIDGPMGTFTPKALLENSYGPIIAPFFADVDTHSRHQWRNARHGRLFFDNRRRPTRLGGELERRRLL